MTPFAMSSSTTGSPSRGPNVRQTFVAPVLPEPYLRMSSWRTHLTIQKPQGIEPSTYAPASSGTSQMLTGRSRRRTLLRRAAVCHGRDAAGLARQAALAPGEQRGDIDAPVRRRVGREPPPRLLQLARAPHLVATALLVGSHGDVD